MAKLYVFVYGTLKRGFGQDRLLHGQEFIRAAATVPKYRLFDQGRYPCLVDDPEDGVAVQGELWRVEEAVLPTLDTYEGAPALFQRAAIEVEGLDQPAIAYFYNGDVSRLTDIGGAWPGR